MRNLSVQHYSLLALLLLVALVAFNIILPFLAPLILGIVLAVVLRPVYTRVLDRVKGRETLAAFLTVLISCILLLVPLVFLSAQVLIDAQELYASFTEGQAQSELQRMVEDLGPAAEEFVPGANARLAEALASADEYATLALSWMIQNIGVAFSGLATVFLNLFILMFTLFYILRDGVALKARIVEISPLADRDDLKIFQRLEVAVNSVVKGKLVIALIQGVLTGIGFAFFGVPNPVFWGVVGAIAALIPPFGSALVIVPAALFLALTGQVGAAIGLGAWGAVAVGLIDNVLAPRLMSHGTSLHPLLVLLSVLGGLAFFGPIGIFLGPLTMSLLITLLAIHADFSRDHQLQEKP